LQKKLKKEAKELGKKEKEPKESKEEKKLLKKLQKEEKKRLKESGELPLGTEEELPLLDGEDGAGNSYNKGATFQEKDKAGRKTSPKQLTQEQADAEGSAERVVDVAT